MTTPKTVQEIFEDSHRTVHDMRAVYARAASEASTIFMEHYQNATTRELTPEEREHRREGIEAYLREGATLLLQEMYVQLTISSIEGIIAHSDPTRDHTHDPNEPPHNAHDAPLPEL